MPAQVDLDEFRDEVRQFLNESLPSRISNKVRSGLRMTKADYEEWHAILNEKGWLAVNWPVEFGGTGWTADGRSI
ncbi:MAG: acyl-CoA dehydrogenase family protein, partial [Pseudomonadota bacterium]